MQQELNRQLRLNMPDNDKVLERVRSPTIDSNKLSMETQTTNTTSPIKSKIKRTKTVGSSLSCMNTATCSSDEDLTAAINKRNSRTTSSSRPSKLLWFKGYRSAGKQLNTVKTQLV